MASDNEDRKHRRSSDEESEEPSKRRKHRHHHRRRHHRHHSRKHDAGDEEVSDMAPPPPPPPVENSRPDYDMEEGEIVEDDAESGEIKTETDGDGVVPNHSISSFLNDGDHEKDVSKIRETVDEEENLSEEHNDNGYVRAESRKGNGYRKSHYDDDYETKDRKKSHSNDNHLKVYKESSSKIFNERRTEDAAATSRSRSHEQGKDRSRSRSRSIPRGASRLETHREEVEYYTFRKHGKDGDPERTKKLTKDYPHVSRDSVRDRERERSSSRSRHSQQVDRYHSREPRERIREGSWDARDRDRYRERDLKEMDRERSIKDRESDRRERDSRHRERTRDIDSERGISRNRRNYNYHDATDGRGRGSEYKDHRYEETDYRDKSKKYEAQEADSLKADEDTGKIKREEADEELYQERSSLQVEEDEEEEDLNRIKEESRRRRQAILEKYRAKSEPRSQDIVKEELEEPLDFVDAAKVNSGILDSHGEGSDTNTGDTPFSVGRSPPQNGNSVVERTFGTGGLGEGTPKSERSNGDGDSPPRVRVTNERSNDMFSDDIFGESPTGVQKHGKGDGLAIHISGLQDNWDDAEGYYKYHMFEVLDGRYKVDAALGKGVFSTVVRAKDLKVIDLKAKNPKAISSDPEEVAIKIIRNNDKMYKAGLEELVILKKLVGEDPEDRRHCVRFLSSFKYRNHLCLVFESLEMNLREVLKKYGRNIGLKLTAVRAYAKQLFIALKHLRNCGVLHTDIKPDNMLVNGAKNVLKLCDFGNAMFAGKNEITPYLVSRFYRAPEIILGLTYDHPVDMWSVGCCLFELYTGKVLFPGGTNNEMLRFQMELKGPFPRRMLRKGAFTELHFDQDLNFVAIEEDPVTKKIVKRQVNIRATGISSILRSFPGEDPKMVANFKDLLEKIFMLDPDKRLTVQQALGHPFITGK
uniref:serine/threonine-protein kinase prpf4B-like isoform X2 n=1 Tax=Erigeron canadensis TaxID=72917 RepID=UPI001CB8BD46|nr:serine/threonine-protein kinase prpf4B-like isoform X2 [Erigeron canadensis]